MMTSFFVGCTNYTDLITQILMEVMFVMQQSEVNPFLSTTKSVALKSPAKRSGSPIQIRFVSLDLSHYLPVCTLKSNLQRQLLHHQTQGIVMLS